METIEGDRRTHPRLALAQPCKIYDPHTGKYIAGSTQDISTTGALIEVPRLLGLKPGDTLHIGVALKRRQGLLKGAEMLKAAVMRAVQTVDDHTLLGLCFQEPHTAEADAPMEIAPLRLAA